MIFEKAIVSLSLIKKPCLLVLGGKFLISSNQF